MCKRGTNSSYGGADSPAIRGGGGSSSSSGKRLPLRPPGLKAPGLALGRASGAAMRAEAPGCVRAPLARDGAQFRDQPAARAQESARST